MALHVALIQLQTSLGSRCCGEVFQSSRSCDSASILIGEPESRLTRTMPADQDTPVNDGVRLTSTSIEVRSLDGTAAQRPSHSFVTFVGALLVLF